MGTIGGKFLSRGVRIRLVVLDKTNKQLWELLNTGLELMSMFHQEPLASSKKVPEVYLVSINKSRTVTLKPWPSDPLQEKSTPPAYLTVSSLYSSAEVTQDNSSSETT